MDRIAQGKIPVAVYAISLYLILSGFYAIHNTITSDFPDSAMILIALLFQSCKVIAGASFYLRKKFTPYILCGLLAWSIFSTGNAYLEQPDHASTLSITIYVRVVISVYIATIIYSFWLRKRGFYATREIA